MEISSYFSNIQNIIIEEIKKANKEILVAVAWFTSIDIFKALLDKLEKKVSVKLLIINDDINNREGGLGFQEFIDKGGLFYFAELSVPMHNKYIIIDNKVVITGSYNYTYFAEALNEENVIKIDGACDIINGYIHNFHKLISNIRTITSINDYHISYPPQKNAFSFSHYGMRDIYQQSILLKAKGEENEAKKLVALIEAPNNNKQKQNPANYTISPVIYRQWKDDYILDKVEYKNGELIFKYRTYPEPGSWISAPQTKRCWIIRSSNDHKKLLKCTRVCNICIDGNISIKDTELGTIYYLNNDLISNFSNNPCGYKINKEKKMIDDNGDLVPVRFIHIKGRCEMTCDVCFETDDEIFTNGIIDFIEGEGCESRDNFWNCFDINLRLNRS